MTPRVDVAFACSAHQTPNWWLGVFSMLLKEMHRGTFDLGQLIGVQSALPEFNKNRSVGGIFAPEIEAKRNQLTDVNREVLTGWFLTGSESGVKSDWIFWIDDDTVPPDGTISQLLRLEKPFTAGLYFNTNSPYNPICYLKAGDTGGYRHLWDYNPGSVIQVDSVGMGCTLIHRSVYEKILEEFVVFQRPNGSLFPIHKSLVYTDDTPLPGSIYMPSDVFPKTYVYNNILHMKLVEPEPDNSHFFPFYAMEYCRTEDNHFCELAEQVGIKPWIDTAIVCEHWKHRCGTYDDYQKEVARVEIPEDEE
jgi:hypothetical protein